MVSLVTGEAKGQGPLTAGLSTTHPQKSPMYMYFFPAHPPPSSFALTWGPLVSYTSKSVPVVRWIRRKGTCRGAGRGGAGGARGTLLQSQQGEVSRRPGRCGVPMTVHEKLRAACLLPWHEALQQPLATETFPPHNPERHPSPLVSASVFRFHPFVHLPHDPFVPLISLFSSASLSHPQSDLVVVLDLLVHLLAVREAVGNGGRLAEGQVLGLLSVGR
mgnify:CR=1 FL=1